MESQDLIRLVEGNGDEILVEGGVQLEDDRHNSVVATLRTRAHRITARQQGRTGYGTSTLWEDTVDLDVPSEREDQHSRFDVRRALVREQVVADAGPDENLQTHGTPPGSKPDGVCRILYENMNGLDCRHLQTRKVVKARRLHDELEADIVAYNEHRVNLKHKDNQNGFKQLFQGGESDIKALGAHNVHENIGRIQEGGTAMVAFGPLTQHIDLQHARDPTGLGRWVVMTLRGAQGFVTRVVCGYNPCGNSKLQSGTTYQQHRRYFLTKHKSSMCPRVKFREDLLAQLLEWRENGDWLIVCLDANEDIYKVPGKSFNGVFGSGDEGSRGGVHRQTLGRNLFPWVETDRRHLGDE